MSQVKRNKLHSLLKMWPRGAVGTSSWLCKHGYSYDLIKKYEQSGWIQSVGIGAYVRSDDKVLWSGAIWALQKQLNKNIHIGAKAALLLLGYGHHIPLSRMTVSLIGAPKERIPKWFLDNKWNIFINYETSSLFSTILKEGLEEKEIDGFKITVSSTERAIMELIDTMNVKQGLEEAHDLMSGLATLRPSVVRNLLKQCNSIKVKRVFLYLAEQAGHTWFTKLKWQDLDLGSGARSYYKGGVFNSKFLITIPKTKEIP